MNKKGKNKKGKIPNPIPSQEEKTIDKVEDLLVGGDTVDLEKPSEVVENVEVKQESVKEARVPETVSETVTSLIVKDEETPKKPKRNRGKKKKGKEDDIDDNLEEIPIEKEVLPPVTIKNNEPIKIENEPIEENVVTPTARKKKNKKKNVELKPEEPVDPDIEKASEVMGQNIIQDIVEASTKQEDVIEADPAEPDLKQSKKKNKKKKRNDSEKSDKELVSCTSAFQTLIEAKDNTSEVSKEESTESKISSIQDIKCEEPQKTNLPETHIEVKVPELPIEDKITGMITMPESKNKKKNKKEKKEAPKTDENITMHEEPTLDWCSLVTEKELAETKISPAQDIKIEETKTIEHQETKTEVKLPDLATEEQSAEMAFMPDSKNKKKNKKNKKETPKSDENIIVVDETTSAPSLLPVKEEIELKDVGSEEPIKENIVIENPEGGAETEDIKHKAKIAKPVEKKRKGKQNNEPIETTLQGINEPKTEEPSVSLPCPPQSVLEILDETKEKDTMTSTVMTNLPEQKPGDIPIPSSSDFLEQASFQLFAPLNLPEKSADKKRKKGSKFPKTPDVSFEVFDFKLESDAKHDVNLVDTVQDLPVDVSDNSKTKEPKENIVSETWDSPTIVDCQSEPIPFIEPITQAEKKGHVLLTPDTIEETDLLHKCVLLPKDKEDTQKTETKSGKKRKKSPKPAKKTEELVKVEAPTTEVRETSENIDPLTINQPCDTKTTSIQLDKPDFSACETIPDVTYPRSVSQQSYDNNNNDTVIREIVQEIKPDLPVMQSTLKPEISLFTKKNVSPPKDEKTDLKSKMMEVNQDMEELRLSIERSLAELTSIEKSEEVIERAAEFHKYEPLKVKDKDITSMKEEQPTISEVSKPEKSDVMKLSETMPTSLLTQTKGNMSLLDYKHHAKSNIAELTKQTDVVKSDVIQSETIKDAKSIVDPVIDTLEKPAKLIKPETTNIVPDETVKTIENIAKTEKGNIQEAVPPTIIPLKWTEENIEKKEKQTEEPVAVDKTQTNPDTPPICPARKDNKNKNKKKKGKVDAQTTPTQPAESGQATTTAQTSATSGTTAQNVKKDEKTEKKTEKKDNSKCDTKEKGKQQASGVLTEKDIISEMEYEPIENFEDALTSSSDDVNKTFEMIVQESEDTKINVVKPDEEKKAPVSPSKNLLGHPDIPVPSSRRDYKREKDKIPNEVTAVVNVKDSVDVERKKSKNTQTTSKLKDLNDSRISDNEEFVYKYSFRKVFLQNSCLVCKKELTGTRVACCYCNLVFYCGIKHKEEDWAQHQEFCFAVSTIGHLKDQKHIYADAKNLTGHDYRLVRMQMIVSCEKILKRRLVPWEQEALLYPRVCGHVPCREWRQLKLTDCQGCGQISYCTENPDHYPKSHSRWCKSYNLYQKLVSYQQTVGRLEPKLPTKVMREKYEIPEKINEVLAGMYEEKLDLNDIQYAALTQLATAPLTAAYCHQLYRNKNIISNGYKKSTFTIHVVGAELQFEADALNKWEVFFLHLRPDVQELRVVLINYNLNPSNLPLELLGKIKLCNDCKQNKRRVVFNFQDKRTYSEYKTSDDFVVPDIVCAFNPSIQRSSVYNGKDPWPSAVNVILKQKIPFIITAYTITELHKDCIRMKECSEISFNFISEPKNNNFASVRPDRNFISDDEIPLLFKNYCYAIICG